MQKKQNLKITKAGFFTVLFFAIMLFPVNGFSAAQQADDWLDEPVTVRFQNEPLSTVLEKVSKQTGIAILYDQELANDKVSGNYKDVKASDAITRLFSGKNKSIQVSKDKKVIVVKTFGAKNFIWAGSTKGQESSSQMTLAELGKLHAQQYKEYKERIANDNEVLEGGITRGEIRAMHEHQSREFHAQLTDDSEILSEGLTRGELRTMYEGQYKAYQARIANASEKLEGSVTSGEIKTMHKQQYKGYQSRISNDDEINEGGMTRSEIRLMLEKQSEEYKKQQDRS